jgi:hypothetical protein
VLCCVRRYWWASDTESSHCCRSLLGGGARCHRRRQETDRARFHALSHKPHMVSTEFRWVEGGCACGIRRPGAGVEEAKPLVDATFAYASPATRVACPSALLLIRHRRRFVLSLPAAGLPRFACLACRVCVASRECALLGLAVDVEREEAYMQESWNCTGRVECR